MSNGGTDDIGMAHHHHGAFRHRSSHFIEMVSDSALHLDYSLSPRRTALTARFVPAPPIIAVFQAFKGPSRPFAEINFIRSEEHTSELQSLMRISYAVFCLKKKQHKSLIPPLPLTHYIAPTTYRQIQILLLIDYSQSHKY